MATVDLGKIRVHWRGAYSSSTTYEYNDGVTYNNSSYAYINNTATAGTTPTTTTHWQIIAQGACEQCGLNWLPRIRKIVNICDWVQSSMLGQKIALIPNAEMKLSEVKLANEINIIIGPEGDFTDSERKVLDYNNFKCTSMGKRILRSETAAISSLSALRTLSGEF